MALYPGGIPLYVWILGVGSLLVLFACAPWRRIWGKVQNYPRSWTELRQHLWSLRLWFFQIVLLGSSFALGCVCAVSWWQLHTFKSAFVPTLVLTLSLYLSTNTLLIKLSDARATPPEKQFARRPIRLPKFSIIHVMVFMVIFGLSIVVIERTYSQQPLADRVAMTIMVGGALSTVTALAWMGLDTLIFGRGSGRRANRLHELEAKRRDALSSSDEEDSPVPRSVGQVRDRR